MPSSITHAYFSLDVYDRLDDKTKKNLKPYKEQLKSFAQGPDCFYFYKNKEIKQLGRYAHRHNTLLFFKNIINYIKEYKLTNNYEVISFLYGYLTHYALDATTHPYIFYKTGVFNIKDAKTYKYSGLHNNIEGYIDYYLIKTKEKIKPNYFKSYQFCFNVNHFSNSLNEMIDTVFLETFDKKNISKIYLDGIKCMKTFFFLFRYDPNGIKKRLYKFIDFITPAKTKKIESLSYYLNDNKKRWYLNLDKDEWNHPVDINEIYDYSFIELYVIALNWAVDMIKAVNKVLYENKSIRILDNIIMNKSYINGKDCNLKLKMKYFAF